MALTRISFIKPETINKTIAIPTSINNIYDGYSNIRSIFPFEIECHIVYDLWSLLKNILKDKIDIFYTEEREGLKPILVLESGYNNDSINSIMNMNICECYEDNENLRKLKNLIVRPNFVCECCPSSCPLMKYIFMSKLHAYDSVIEDTDTLNLMNPHEICEACKIGIDYVSNLPYTLHDILQTIGYISISQNDLVGKIILKTNFLDIMNSDEAYHRYDIVIRYHKPTNSSSVEELDPIRYTSEYIEYRKYKEAKLLKLTEYYNASMSILDTHIIVDESCCCSSSWHYEPEIPININRDKIKNAFYHRLDSKNDDKIIGDEIVIGEVVNDGTARVEDNIWDVKPMSDIKVDDVKIESKKEEGEIIT